MLPTRDPVWGKCHTDWKWGDRKRYFMQTEKKMGIAIIISNNIDFKIKAIKKDKEGQCIIIKGSIQGEDTTLVNIYEPNIEAS